MEYAMGAAAQTRLLDYFSEIGKVLGNAKRRESFATYAMGLLGESERKSIEPLAMRFCTAAKHADAAHQKLHHFVTHATWDDRRVRTHAARYAIAAMTRSADVASWIIDDTGFLKQGKHSVGVQRQYTGSAGKITNCQLGVSLTVATPDDACPIDFELYLPRLWADDAARRKQARIPDEVPFRTKVELAIDMVERAAREGVPKGILLADAFYGDEPSFRRSVRSLGMHYAVGIKSDLRVVQKGRSEKPMTALALASALPKRAFRRVTWREGTRHTLASRFATVRVVPAHASVVEARFDREEVWLLIEWPEGEPKPTRYSLSSLPALTSKKRLVHVVKDRWRTERVYEDLKGELGLDHFEGRSFPGWHHHVSLVLCCYAFVCAERSRHFPPSTECTPHHGPLRFAA